MIGLGSDKKRFGPGQNSVRKKKLLIAPGIDNICPKVCDGVRVI